MQQCFGQKNTRENSVVRQMGKYFSSAFTCMMYIFFHNVKYSC